jgi:endogenous inhibitor of DNA gyrase (YacG/DUF329 family)
LSTTRKIPCPRCGAPAAFSPSNPWRPFCSERCKLIDLGNWANERYRVPASVPQGDDADRAPDDADPA